MKYIKTFESLYEDDIKSSITKYGTMKLRYIYKYDKYPNKTYVNGKTLLMLACECRNQYLVKDLIHFGADVNKQDNEGRTALMIITHMYIYDTVTHSKKNIIQMLIDNGADLNITDKNGNSAIFYLNVGDYTTLGTLIENGADIKHKNNNGNDVFKIYINTYDSDDSYTINQFIQDKYPEVYKEYLIGKEAEEKYNL